MLKLDRKKLDIVLARRCMSITEAVKLAGISNALLTRVLSNKCTLTPKTLGKISKALNVDPTELLEEDTKC